LGGSVAVVLVHGERGMRLAARLLRQPHCFEGLGGIAVADDAPDPTPLQLENESRDGVDIHPALAESTHTANHRYSFLAVVELERVDSERLQVLVHVADELPDALVSSVDDALELRPQRPPLAILGRESEQPIEITGVEGVIGSPDDFNVFLRHRLLRQAHGL
jgi:hypothetical protein